jgi:hypothetical protein
MDIIILVLGMLKELEHQVTQVNKNIKVAQDRKKRYANNKMSHNEFKVGDHLYLRIKPRRSSLRMGTCANMVPLFCGTF